MATKPSTSLHYNPRLDGLRALAILLVVFSHFQFKSFRGGGSFGVNIFFVLSGFLITLVLVNHHQNHISLRLFYWRRFIRLAPAALFLYLIYYLYSTLFHNQFLSTELAIRDIIPSITYLSNWTRALVGDIPMFLGNIWSLSIEEQFYLLWPIIFLFLSSSKFGFKATTIGALFFVILAIIWAIRAEFLQWEVERIYNGFDTRFSGLMIGCLLALITLNQKAQWLLSALGHLWPVAIISTIYTVTFLKNDNITLTSLIASLSAVIFICSAHYHSQNQLAKILTKKIFIYIGKISYGLYLWHYPVWYILFCYRLPWLTVASIGLPFSFAFAIISYEIIEKKALSWRYLPEYLQKELGGITLTITIILIALAGLILLNKPLKEIINPPTVKILDYSPAKIGVGETINVQMDGQSYFLIASDQKLPKGTKIKIGNQTFNGFTVDNITGVAIPPKLLIKPGTNQVVLKTYLGTTLAPPIYFEVIDK